jgi:hypothetical protein
LLLEQRVRNPRCRVTHGALLDYLMETHGLTRNKARVWKREATIELYGTARIREGQK